MNLLMLSTMLTLSFTFLFLNHPLSFGLILLLQTLLIAMMTGLMTLNYWFSYIIFLIMVGGMLVLFIYMTSIASNEKFKFSMKIFLFSSFLMAFFSFFIFSDSFFFNMIMNNNDLTNQMNFMNFSYQLNKFLNPPLKKIFYIMVIYLLLTLIMVVKITNIQYGPLRQKN